MALFVVKGVSSYWRWQGHATFTDREMLANDNIVPPHAHILSMQDVLLFLVTVSIILSEGWRAYVAMRVATPLLLANAQDFLDLTRTPLEMSNLALFPLTM